MFLKAIFEGPRQEAEMAALQYQMNNNYQLLAFGGHFKYRCRNGEIFRIVGHRQGRILIVNLTSNSVMTLHFFDLVGIVESMEDFLQKFSICWVSLNMENDLSSQGLEIRPFKNPRILEELGLELLSFYDALDEEYITIHIKDDFAGAITTITSDAFCDFLKSRASAENANLNQILSSIVFKYLLKE